MRVEKTIKNIKIAILYQFTILLIGFIDRKLFLSVLGVNFLGLHGLFGNIITMLSLAELGVGTAIIYNLYKPLEDQNQEEVAALMQLYKKVYQVIGIVIGVIGMILMFFLPVLIKEPMQNMAYVRGVYLIFLAGTVLTYLTGYKRAVLYADQKNYILLLGDMVANTMGVMIKVITLLTLQNYMAYVVVHATSKVLPNIWANYQVNQLYPYINKIKAKLPLEKLQTVKENIKDLFIHKIAHFVVTSTDSLIISSFIGISTVGYLANYNMIIGALMGFVAQGVEALQASMGNLVVSRSKEKVEEVYDRLTFASFWIGSFCAVALICLIQPFMTLWLGEAYSLDRAIVLMMIINFFLWVLTRPLWQMMTVAGLFKEDKTNAMVEIVVNLVVSLILVQKLGLIGVLIGTMISYIVAWMMKSRLLYRKFFKKSSGHYYVTIIGYGLITLVEVMVTNSICKQINISNEIIRFISQMMVCLMVPNIINLVLFFKTKSFIYFQTLIGDMGMTIRDKLGTDKTKLMMQKILFIIIAVLIFLLPLERTVEPRWHIIGKLAALGIFGITSLSIMYLLLVPRIITDKAKKIIWIYMAGAIGLTVISFFRGGMMGAKAAIMMALMLNVGLAMSYVDYRKIGKWIGLLDIGFVVYIGAMVTHYIKQADWKYAYAYTFIFDNPNYLGLIVMLMIFICLLAYSVTKSKRYLTYPVAFLWVSYMAKGRTALLALAGVLGTIIFWQLIRKNKKIYMTYMALIIGGIIVLTLIYPILGDLIPVEAITENKIAIIGKRLFTGREKQWQAAIALIKQKPFIGYGMNAVFEDLADQDLSTHSVYLELLLQGGVGLLVLFFTMIYWLWGKVYTLSNMLLTRVGAATLVGILIIGTFELTLLGQSISLGIFQWMIIGWGLGQGHRQE